MRGGLLLPLLAGCAEQDWGGDPEHLVAEAWLEEVWFAGGGAIGGGTFGGALLLTVDEQGELRSTPLSLRGSLLGVQVDLSGGFDPFNGETVLDLPHSPMPMPALLGRYRGGQAGMNAVVGVTGHWLSNDEGVGLLDLWLSFGVGTSIGFEVLTLSEREP